MEYYATILNLEDADSFCLQPEELFEHTLQATVSRFVLLGYGQNKHASMAIALQTLQNNGLLKTYKCASTACNILESTSGKNALRHLWLYADNEEMEPWFYPLSGHSEVANFCRRYNLSEEATEDLFQLVSKLL